MKNISKLIIVLLGLNLVLSSCGDDFLEEEIRSDFTPETLNDELGYNLQRQSSAQATTPSSNPDDIQLDITGQ